MLKYDRHDCPTTIEHSKTLLQWNEVIHGFLSHGAKTTNCLNATLELEPDFALAHACKGLFSLLLGRRELVGIANTALQTAKTSARKILLVKGRAITLMRWNAG